MKRSWKLPVLTAVSALFCPIYTGLYKLCRAYMRESYVVWPSLALLVVGVLLFAALSMAVTTQALKEASAGRAVFCLCAAAVFALVFAGLYAYSFYLNVYPLVFAAQYLLCAVALLYRAAKARGQ